MRCPVASPKRAPPRRRVPSSGATGGASLRGASALESGGGVSSQLPPGPGAGAASRCVGQSGNDLPVVRMSGHARIDAAVRATRFGGIDFLEKPLSTDRLLLVMENTLRMVRAEAEAKELRTQTGQASELIGDSRAMT